MYVRVDRSKNCLVITRAIHEHYHETGPELYRCYSENRQLDNSVLRKVHEMANLNVQPQLISSNLRAFTGKSISNKDIHNFVSKLRQKSILQIRQMKNNLKFTKIQLLLQIQMQLQELSLMKVKKLL